ncbi:AMP-binding protein [Bradyrhizobium glycinis]|uniref:AMP-binding protein n=1 Tax=Bradyrhizobium glycinis TaxID=2751812 RepID=UPI0018D5ADA5|nr:AMP-binding protein [Bradyrhizobium glycinis]MBH5373109.1 AMP-binding protein [Bradyrhizobium glycinis]
MLQMFGEKPAFVTSNGAIVSYAELARRADLFAARLGTERRLVLIETMNEIAPLVAYLGALRARHPVILADANALAKDSRTLDLYQPDWIYRFNGSEWHLEKGSGERRKDLHPDLALLLSSSGSTGSPKLVRLSRSNIDANARAIGESLELSTADRPITALPWHYCYGLSVIHSHLACGATILLTARSVVEPGFWDFFEDNQGTSLAGVPHTFELLERTTFLGRRLECLRYLTVAGGRLAPAVVQAYARWARDRGARFFVMYGQTEATARMAYLTPDLVDRYPDCIGIPLPGGQFRILGPDGSEVVESGRAGELVYSGPNVMMGYAQSADDLGRGPELSELKTNDIAERNQEGLYRILGRSSRFSKLFGLRLDFDEIESFLSQKGYIAAVAGNDQRLAIALSGGASAGAVQAGAVQDMVADRYKLPSHVVGVVAVPAIPRLSSGKVDYPAVVELADASASTNCSLQPAEAEAPAAPPGPHGSLAAAFAEAFRRSSVDAEDSFVSLGGDSLSYVQISLIIEDHIGFLPEDWEQLTVGELQAMKQAGAAEPVSRRSWMDTDIFLRALAICGVVVVHAGDISGLYGGSELLFVLAGYNFARFQGKAIFDGRALKALQPFAVNVLLPLFAIIVLHDVVKGGFDIRRYLLIGNFYNLSIQYLYFIEVLFQCLAVLAAIMAIRPIRDYAKEQPWRSGIGLFIAAVAVHFIGLRVSDLAPLDYRVPQFYLYLIVYGWCLNFARSAGQKAIAFALALIVFPHTFVVPSQIFWVMGGSMVLLFVTKVSISGTVRRIVSTISGACFHIYLVHGLPVALLKVPLASYPTIRIYLSLILAILLGKVVGDAFSLIVRRLRFAQEPWRRRPATIGLR